MVGGEEETSCVLPATPDIRRSYCMREEDTKKGREKTEGGGLRKPRLRPRSSSNPYPQPLTLTVERETRRREHEDEEGELLNDHGQNQNA